jgi:hypothetical protein
VSKHSEEVRLEADPARAEEICRLAIAGLGWRVMKDGLGRITAKEVTPTGVSFTNAAKIDVLIVGEQSPTLIRLNGSITGIGPVQKGHLRGQVGALRNQIVVAANQAAASTPLGGASAEIERLARLHQDGLLTDDEFSQAKARALDA